MERHLIIKVFCSFASQKVQIGSDDSKRCRFSGVEFIAADCKDLTNDIDDIYVEWGLCWGNISRSRSAFAIQSRCCSVIYH